MQNIKKNEMTSRERIHATINGLPVDRVPVFIWLNAHTGCKLMSEYKPSRNSLWNLIARFLWGRFKRGGEMDAKELWRFLPLLFDVHSYNFANAYSAELGSDLFMVAHATPWQYAKYSYRNGHILIKDLFGVTRGMGGIYPDMIQPAIKDINDLKNYQFPDTNDERLYTAFRKFRSLYPEVSIAAEVWGVQDFTSTSMFGMERFMIFLYDYPEEMRDFMRRWADFWIEVLTRSLKAGADIIAIFDDYGYDNHTLISMDMWKEFTYPQLKRLIDTTHEAGAPAMLHSCGYQEPFLDYYIEAGVDMLQSFQPKAGNNFQQAYENYHDKLTFITGIDIQLGEYMSSEQLKENIIRNYRTGGVKGRHVLGTTHEIQYTMPAENMRVIFDTIKEIQSGAHDG